MLFGKPKKIVILPKSDSVEVYVDRETKNFLSFPVNLHKENPDIDLLPLNDFLKSEKPGHVVVLLTEDVMVTKSFVYDTKSSTIDKQEVLKLAQDTVNFEIDPDNVEYALNQTGAKTIIQSDFFHLPKFKQLEANLLKLTNLPDKVDYLSYARAISRVINNFYKQEYFCLYTYSKDEHVLFLSKGDNLFLTNKLKGTHPDIQKIINYSNLYFDKTINRLFHPKNLSVEYKSQAGMEKAEFEETSIATQLKLANNLPIAVVGAFIPGNNKSKQIAKTMAQPAQKPVPIILSPKPVLEPRVEIVQPQVAPLSLSTLNIPSVEDTTFSLNKNSSSNKKNKSSLPIIVAIVATAILVSALVWYFSKSDTTDESGNLTPTPTVALEPSPEPTVKPTLAPINKSLKFQVLNATDISGQAALLKDSLLKLGFKTITAGNAPKKSTENLIRVKKKYAELEQYFIQELPSFSATFDATLPDTSSYDIVLTIGTDLSSSSAPANTNTTTTKQKPTPTSADEEVVEEQ